MNLPNTIEEVVSEFKVMIATSQNSEWRDRMTKWLTNRLTKSHQDTIRGIITEVEAMRYEPTLCGKCNLNGPLCKECYANRRANTALESAIATLHQHIK